MLSVQPCTCASPQQNQCANVTSGGSKITAQVNSIAQSRLPHPKQPHPRDWKRVQEENYHTHQTTAKASTSTSYEKEREPAEGPNAPVTEPQNLVAVHSFGLQLETDLLAGCWALFGMASQNPIFGGVNLYTEPREPSRWFLEFHKTLARGQSSAS